MFVFRRGVVRNIWMNPKVVSQQKRFAESSTTTPETPRAKWAAILGNLAALANWGIPISAIASFQKDPSKLNPQMTPVLGIYSMIFMRWSVAVYPRNYVLFACHTVNSIAQTIQEIRIIMYHLNFKKKVLD